MRISQGSSEVATKKKKLCSPKPCSPKPCSPKPSSPKPCKVEKALKDTVSICGFTCNKKKMKNTACTPMRVPPAYCDNDKKSENPRKLNPCKVKVKKENKKVGVPSGYKKSVKSVKKPTPSDNKNLEPCGAHKPVPKNILCDPPPPIKEPTSSCNFDVYMLNKRNKIVPKVVISKGDCNFLSESSGNILPTVKCKLCKPLCPKSDVVFSVKCSATSKKQRSKQNKSKRKNDAGICISMNPGLECVPEKRKGMSYYEKMHFFILIHIQNCTLPIV